MKKRILKYFYFICLCISICIFSQKKENRLIPIEKDGFLSNFLSDTCFINNVRCFLVSPWYMPYSNTRCFFSKAYNYTQDLKQKENIISLACTKDTTIQLMLLKPSGVENNIFIRVYKKYWPITKFFIKFRLLKAKDVLKETDTSCSLVWLLFIFHNVFMYFVFKDKLYGVALLAAPFVSLRLLLVFYSGIAWAHLLLYNKKFHLKYFLVCPYVLLSSASSFLLCLWVFVSKFSVKKKIFITGIIFSLIASKLIVNNEIVNNEIVKNKTIYNKTIYKMKYFAQRAPLFRDFSEKNYFRGFFYVGVFIFFIIFLFKSRNCFLIPSCIAFFLEGLILYFSLPLFIKICLRKN